MNYLIDESDEIGKSANCGISILHHYLQNIHTDAIVLFADNCVQNKNHALICYLKWRIRTGLNKCIELHFMISGHTKFNLNRNFGMFKHYYVTADIDSLKDMVQAVHASSPGGYNVGIAKYLNGQWNVIWYV